MILILPIGPILVRFGGSYLESYKVIPKRDYYGAYGYPNHGPGFTGRLHGVTLQRLAGC